MNEQTDYTSIGEQESIPNYLWQSIVVTILCCWPFGIPAIIFSAKVNGLLSSGQIEEAKKASTQAKMWCWISFGLGLVVQLLSLLYYALVFAVIVAEGQ